MNITLPANLAKRTPVMVRIIEVMSQRGIFLDHKTSSAFEVLATEGIEAAIDRLGDDPILSRRLTICYFCRFVGFSASSHSEAIKTYLRGWEVFKSIANAKNIEYPPKRWYEWPTRSWVIPAYKRLLQEIPMIRSTQERLTEALLKMEGASEIIDLVEHAAQVASTKDWYASQCPFNMLLKSLKNRNDPSKSFAELEDTEFFVVESKLESLTYIPEIPPKGDNLIFYSDGLQEDWQLSEDSLLAHLKNEDSGIRARAAGVLGMRETISERVIPALIDVLQDRIAAVRAMGIFGLHEQFLIEDQISTSLVEKIKNIIIPLVSNDRSYHCRLGAIEFLRDVADYSEENESELRFSIISQLNDALDDKNKQVRAEAVKALGVIGPEAHIFFSRVSECDLGSLPLGKFIKLKAIAQIDPNTDYAKKCVSELVQEARLHPYVIVRAFCFRALFDLSVDDLILQRLCLEAIFLDEDIKIADFARRKISRLLDSETLERLGISNFVG